MMDVVDLLDDLSQAPSSLAELGVGEINSSLDWIDELMKDIESNTAVDQRVYNLETQSEIHIDLADERRVLAILKVLMEHAAKYAFEVEDKGMGFFTINHDRLPRKVRGAVYPNSIDLYLGEGFGVVRTTAPFKALHEWARRVEKNGKKKMVKRKSEECKDESEDEDEPSRIIWENDRKRKKVLA